MQKEICAGETNMLLCSIFLFITNTMMNNSYSLRKELFEEDLQVFYIIEGMCGPTGHIIIFYYDLLICDKYVYRKITIVTL